MQRVGHAWRAKAGRMAEYRRFHAAVWPEVERVLRKHGVRTYVIYEYGDILFSYLEVDDYERMAAAFNASPEAQRWERAVADMIEYIDADPTTGWPVVLPEVWAL